MHTYDNGRFAVLHQGAERHLGFVRFELLLCHWTAKGDLPWYKCLPLLELAYNSTVNRETGYSPFFVHNLHHAVLPLDAMTDVDSETLPHTLSEWVQSTLDSLGVVYDAVLRQIEQLTRRSRRARGNKLLLISKTPCGIGPDPCFVGLWQSF